MCDIFNRSLFTDIPMSRCIGILGAAPVATRTREIFIVANSVFSRDINFNVLHVEIISRTGGRWMHPGFIRKIGVEKLTFSGCRADAAVAIRDRHNNCQTPPYTGTRLFADSPAHATLMMKRNAHRGGLQAVLPAQKLRLRNSTAGLRCMHEKRQLLRGKAPLRTPLRPSVPCTYVRSARACSSERWPSRTPGAPFECIHANARRHFA